MPTRKTAPIRDGEIVTACQQACPTEAIVFGNINDKISRVAKLEGTAAQLRRARRAEHAAADDLYLGSLNPNPELTKAASKRRKRLKG